MISQDAAAVAISRVACRGRQQSVWEMGRCPAVPMNPRCPRSRTEDVSIVLPGLVNVYITICNGKIYYFYGHFQ